MRRFVSRPLIFAWALILAFAVWNPETDAHKAVTSRYSYNVDVFPILRDQCGRCHVEGGPAPMGLMTWNDGPNSATPWAESIRQLIVGEQMPPWYVDSRGPAIKGGFGLSPLESDKLLIWTTGGTPEGDPERKPARVTYQARWSGVAPDLQLPMEAEHTMAENVNDETKEFLISTALSEPRWLKAVDLLPGAPEIVRNALITLENGTVLAVWVPGDTLVTAPAGTGFRLPAGAKLRLQIHYKKQWQNEGKTIKDRSVVGLYFTPRPAAGREIQSFVTERPSGGTLASAARVVAVRPSLDKVYGSLTVQAVTPAKTKVVLLRLRVPRPEWRRRYWLVNPVDLPAGSRIEFITTPPSTYIDLSGAQLMKAYPLQVGLDFVGG
jgi:hypothetical protein